MPRHFAAFITIETSPGVLIIPQQLSVATAVGENPAAVTLESYDGVAAMQARIPLKIVQQWLGHA
jgi:hypothetical protein